MARLRVDLTGQRFGRLTVIVVAGQDRQGKTVWRCRCDCGTERSVRANSLRRGYTRSCGCWQREITAGINHRHGGARRRRNHPLYGRWLRMRERCRNPKNKRYQDYGRRGITVCERWNNFALFLADVGMPPTPKHTLERVNNDGPYAPDNVRWATRAEQQQNTRRSR